APNERDDGLRRMNREGPEARSLSPCEYDGLHEDSFRLVQETRKSSTVQSASQWRGSGTGYSRQKAEGRRGKGEMRGRKTTARYRQRHRRPQAGGRHSHRVFGHRRELDKDNLDRRGHEAVVQPLGQNRSK